MIKKKKFAMRVVIIGAGKVGSTLARAIRAAGGSTKLYSARKFKPKTRVACDLLVLAVRDRDLGPLAEKIAESGNLSKRTACVHVAGALTEPCTFRAARTARQGLGRHDPWPRCW